MRVLRVRWWSVGIRKNLVDLPNFQVSKYILCLDMADVDVRHGHCTSAEPNHTWLIVTLPVGYGLDISPHIPRQIDDFFRALLLLEPQVFGSTDSRPN